MKEQSQPPAYLNPNPNPNSIDTFPRIETMSASTNIILNERMEEQSPPMPPPSVRAVQSVGSLLALFFILQGIVDYFVLRVLVGMAQTVEGGLLACVPVAGNGTTT